MPQLFLALEGKLDFVKKTNPFSAPDKKPADPASIEAAEVALDAINAKAKMKVGKVMNG